MPEELSSNLARVSIFDTTLRDGEQAPGNAMDPEAKFELALSIEALGGDYIETGFPASPPSEVEATRLISKGLTTAKFVTFFSDTYLAERGPVAVLAHRSTTAEDGTYRIEADARANGLKMAERHGRSDVPGRERREPR